MASTYDSQMANHIASGFLQRGPMDTTGRVVVPFPVARCLVELTQSHWATSGEAFDRDGRSIGTWRLVPGPSAPGTTELTWALQYTRETPE